MTIDNNNENTASIIDTSFYSIGFPEQDAIVIERDNYVSQIDDYLDNGIKLLFIDGDEDLGKTTLCAQYAKRNIKNTITVFFNPLNSLDYSISFFCSNVVYQLKFILGEDVSMEVNSLIGIEQYQQYIFQVRKVQRKSLRPLTLIIDGLEETMKRKDEFAKSLISILPLGQETFNLIITGSETDFRNLYNKAKLIPSKPITLSGFAEPEINKYLDTNLGPENRDIYKITKGYPGRLKTLKRLLKNEAYSLDQITNSTTYKSWVELDCDSVDHTIAINNAVLSLFALTDKTYNIEELSKICVKSIQEIENCVESIAVLERTPKQISFISNAYKRYYSNLLRGNKKIVQDLLINYYANTDTINSLIELPKIYAEKNDWINVLKVIDTDYSKKIIQSTESIKYVNDSLAIGLIASEKSSSYTEMWRYSVEGGILNELDNFLFWESEVKARISIQDFTGAISLAESAILKVDRLKLLALIARREKEIKNSVDEDLVNLIQQLYRTTDLESVGDKIYDIVADLIYAIPNLAIEMIEKSSGKAADSDINDWIVAKLSIAAVDSSLKEKEDLENSKKIAAIQSLSNTDVKKINKAITFLVGNYSASKVIEEVKKLSDSAERLKLLRLWLANNKNNSEDIASVISLGLDELITSTSENSVTLDVLKELSQQLPYIKDLKEKDELYFRFKNIENSLSNLGLTRNKYTYELNMFHAEFTLSKNESISSINKLLRDIENIPDKLVRLESYAEAFIKLSNLNHKPLVPKINFIYSRILQLSKDIFSSTANHLQLCKHILKTIGKRNPALSLKICNEMNVLYSREKGKSIIYESYLDNNLKSISFSILKEIEESFQFQRNKNSFYIEVLERFASAKSLPYLVIKDLMYFIDKLRYFNSPIEKTFAYVQALKVISKNVDWKNRLARKFENLIIENWRNIEAEWQKIDIGFTICADLANLNSNFAKEIFEETTSLKYNTWIDSSPVAEAYLNSMKLVVRAFANLSINSPYSNEDIKILTDLMDRIPSQIEKLELWTELGFHCLSNNEELFAKKIYNEHVVPLIEGIIGNGLGLYRVLDSLTFVHTFNVDLFNKYLLTIEEETREQVYSRICDFYVTNRNPYEIYDLNVKRFKSNFSDLTKAISILGKLNTDAFIYDQMEQICNSLEESRNEITKPQNASLVNNLLDIASKKFPDKKNIVHDGYKILAEMKISKVKRENIDHNSFWKSIILRAESIPNISDMVFVKAILLDEVPFERISSGDVLKNKLYQDIINDLDKFASHYEFLQRVIDISLFMYNVNRSDWRKQVQKAFVSCFELTESIEGYNSQSRIIDTMYRMDPDFAKELIKLSDSENQKNKFAKLLQRQLDMLEISNKIKNNKSLESNEKDKSMAVISGIVNALKSINSNKIAPKKIGEAASFLSLGNKLPLHESFPVYMYYLTNCSKIYKGAQKIGLVNDLHKENFKKVVMSTNLIEILANRRKNTEGTYRTFFIEENFVTNKTVNPGSREAAISFIKGWLFDEVNEFIIIADPYFQKEDLEILKMIRELKFEIDISILGSKDGSNVNVEASFKEYWKNISDEEPPFTNITFCWIPEAGNQTPFHDRWIITKNSGLRMGTSINSLGKNKESELSIMKPSEAMKIKEHSLIEYVERKKKSVNNQRISYKSFSL